ncbi:CSG1/SUR1-like protein [Ophidiomyces ophidiicola]|nr:CSG1/SUR1-like protein [Ophidiomyces ophidiicola]
MVQKYDVLQRPDIEMECACAFLVDPNCELPLYQIQNTGEFVNRLGLSRKHILDAVDASVQRLGTYIDVLQIHRLDRGVHREEIMRALNDVVESGKSYHNLLNREGEREMTPYCVDSGVGLIPWSPLARGALTRPLGSRSTVREQSDKLLKTMIRDTETEADKIIIGRVEELAKKRVISMAQVATAWSLSKWGICPILGLGSKERIDEAVASVKAQLTEEEISYLEEAYVPKVVSPMDK